VTNCSIGQLEHYAHHCTGLVLLELEQDQSKIKNIFFLKRKVDG
jgi:hypothetical protein